MLKSNFINNIAISPENQALLKKLGHSNIIPKEVGCHVIKNDNNNLIWPGDVSGAEQADRFLKEECAKFDKLIAK